MTTLQKVRKRAPLERGFIRRVWVGETRYALHKTHGWLVYFESELGAVCSGWIPTTFKPKK